jgi:hypothetical protein
VERSAVFPVRKNNIPMAQDPANAWMPATAAQQAALFAARFCYSWKTADLSTALRSGRDDKGEGGAYSESSC